MKKKSTEIEENMLHLATHWNLTYTPDEKLKTVYDLENIGGCGNCNPRRERAKYNGKCPCCEVRKYIVEQKRALELCYTVLRGYRENIVLPKLQNLL